MIILILGPLYEVCCGYQDRCDSACDDDDADDDDGRASNNQRHETRPLQGSGTIGLGADAIQGISDCLGLGRQGLALSG